MASDMADLLTALNVSRCIVIGHDRGGRVTYRMALDHPKLVSKCVVLDILPTSASWDMANKEFMLDTFHWAFLAQEQGLPQHMITLDPDFWHNWIMRQWAVDLSAHPDEIWAEYRRCFRRKEVIAGTCADYLAGATIDDKCDREDMKMGRKITCPLLALWAGKFGNAENYALDVWRQWGINVSGRGFDNAGHFLPEESPLAILPSILSFIDNEGRAQA